MVQKTEVLLEAGRAAASVLEGAPDSISVPMGKTDQSELMGVGTIVGRGKMPSLDGVTAPAASLVGNQSKDEDVVSRPSE